MGRQSKAFKKANIRGQFSRQDDKVEKAMKAIDDSYKRMGVSTKKNMSKVGGYGPGAGRGKRKK